MLRNVCGTLGAGNSRGTAKQLCDGEKNSVDLLDGIQGTLNTSSRRPGVTNANGLR